MNRSQERAGRNRATAVAIGRTTVIVKAQTWTTSAIGPCERPTNNQARRMRG
jgi:hypothetical protein